MQVPESGYGYRTALYLSALIAAVHCCFLIYAWWHLPYLANRVLIYVLSAAAVSLGLWLLSKVARYGGAAFYLLSAAAAAFPWVGFDRKLTMSVGAVWVITMGVLSLVAALFLVFSKPFGYEFAVEREKRPIYKKHLLKAFTVLIVLAAVAATVNDIANLASN